jgi:hypothetical protein
VTLSLGLAIGFHSDKDIISKLLLSCRRQCAFLFGTSVDATRIQMTKSARDLDRRTSSHSTHANKADYSNALCGLVSQSPRKRTHCAVGKVMDWHLDAHSDCARRCVHLQRRNETFIMNAEHQRRVAFAEGDPCHLFMCALTNLLIERAAEAADF